MKCIRLCMFSFHMISVLLIFTSALYAQPIVTDIPAEYEEPVEAWITDSERNTSPFYKGRFSDGTTAQMIQVGQIVAVANEMISLFESRDWGDNEYRQQKILNQLQRFLGALKVALSTQGIEGALDQKAEQNIFLESLNAEKFGLESLKIEPLVDANGFDVSGYFGGTNDELMLFEYAEDGEEIHLLLTREQVREWRLLEDALTNLMVEQIDQISIANISKLKNAVVRWENFLDNGYSQMPWESVINGWVIGVPEFPSLGPPNHQWLFMHPTIGLEVNSDSLDEIRVKEILHIELLGHIWYRGNQLDQFSGISLSASLREDLDPGIGVMFHIKRNWSVGVSWHDVEEDPFLFFSVDLFRFAKQNATEYVKKYEAVREQLGVN